MFICFNVLGKHLRGVLGCRSQMYDIWSQCLKSFCICVCGQMIKVEFDML